MNFRGSDEAVSEAVGFILLTFIITLSIAIVMMTGYQVFIGMINEAHMQNMEKGFYLMSNNANKVVLFESPQQASELKMDGGVLSLKNDGYINISYWDNTGFDFDNRSIIALEYEIGDEKVAYIMGGVCKKEGSYSVMLHEPLIYFNNVGAQNSTLFMSLIGYQNDFGAIAGTGIAHLTFTSPYYSKMLSTIRYPETKNASQVSKINITMKSDYNYCFSQYFKSLGFNPSMTPDGVLTMERGFNQPITLYIQKSLIAVTIS